MNGAAFTIGLLADHPEHIEAIARWHWDEWGAAYADSSLKEWSAALQRKAQREGVPCAWIALVGGTPVGSVVLEDDGVEPRPDLRPDLAGLFVLPDFRHRGIGSALVRECEEGARAAGVSELFLDTSEAEALYRRLGWETIERTAFQGATVAVMRRLLAQPIRRQTV